MLPAAGYRVSSNGESDRRGLYGYYWSSSENGSSYARYLTFGSGGAGTYYLYRNYGRSVRYVAE